MALKNDEAEQKQMVAAQAKVQADFEAALEREGASQSEDAAKQVESNLEARSRNAYFDAHPGASEASYLLIRGELINRIRIEETLNAARIRGRRHSLYSEC
jgi:hypothetical protein